VCVATDYGIDDPGGGSEIESLRREDFSHLHVFHPASYTMGYGGSLPERKAIGA
jgi:hypothetical protein